MTIQAFLDDATKQLSKAGIATARLDTLVLLEDVLQKDRALILAHPDAELPYLTEVELRTKVTQRAEHTPLAYIRGKANFYGREFVVNEGVLCPRPETEVMIDLLKDTHFTLQGPLPVRFADIGCGSGCIGITAALEIPNAKVDFFDIDENAQAVTFMNTKALGLQPSLPIISDLLQYLPTDYYYDALLANLPYVPNDYPINKAATHEPPHALFAGPDGLKLYRRFWSQLAKRQPARRPAYIFTEALPRQHAALAELAASAGYRTVTERGFIQKFKLQR